MMDFDEIIVKESPGLCRCCLSEGCYKDLSTEYSWMSDTEIYADMLLECFDISISQHIEGPNGPNRLICEVCITRLRDACNFKKQVLDSEKKFVDMLGRGEFQPKVVIYETPLKNEEMVEETLAEDVEVEYLEDDMDFGDDLPLRPATVEPSISNITVDALKVKGKRGRPKKSTAIKTEKKAKVPKLDDKPRTSKAVSKDYSNAKEYEYDIVYEQRKILSLVLDNCTVMPFRWYLNKYMCFYCTTEFVESTRLREHTRQEHDEVKLKTVLKTIDKNSIVKLDVSAITCKRCPKPVRDLQDFFNHAFVAHDIDIDRDSCGFLYAFKLSDGEMNCLDCGENFIFFGNLLRHVPNCYNKPRPYLCETCGQGFLTKAFADLHIKQEHLETSFPCRKCNEIFHTASDLKKHSNVHKKYKVKCPICPEVLRTRYLRKRHVAIFHNEKSAQFTCDECSLIFIEKHVLVKHKLNVHQKQKCFTCHICGFKVFSNFYLQRHMVKHSDIRPFECDYCKKTFQRKSTLQYHIGTHLNKKKINRRLPCSECGREFARLNGLKSHMRSRHNKQIT